MISIFSGNVGPNVITHTIPLGPEIVVNGGFSSGADWTLGANWSIGAGVLHASGASSSSNATNSGVCKVGRRFRTVYTVLNWVVRTSFIKIGVTQGPNHSANGTFTTDITCLTNGIILLGNAGSNPNYNIDNVSVKELNAKYEDDE